MMAHETEMAVRDLIADHIIHHMADQKMPLASLAQCDALRRALDDFFASGRGRQLLSNSQQLGEPVSNHYKLVIIDCRQRDVQAIGAAISTRNWHALETAYNALRDKMDAALIELEASHSSGAVTLRGLIKNCPARYSMYGCPAAGRLARIEAGDAPSGETIAEILSALIALGKWFDTDAEILNAMPEAERADNGRQLAKIRAAIAKAKGAAA